MSDQTNKQTFQIELSPEQKEQIRQAIGHSFSTLELTPELKLEAAQPEESAHGKIKPCRWARAYIATQHKPGEDRSQSE